MPRPRAILTLLLLICFTADARGTLPSSYEDALRSAASTDSIAIFDFFTDWCAPCKAFEMDLAEGGPLSGLGTRITLLRIDAEDPAWAQITLRHDIHSFPTFVAVDLSGAEVYRWVGYEGPEHFTREYEVARSHPISIRERIYAFERAPTVEAAQEIADYLGRCRRYAESAQFHERVIELDPDQAAESRWAAFEASRASCELYLPVPWPVMRTRADAVLEEPELDANRIIRVALGMRAAAKLEGNLEPYIPYLSAALAVEPDPEDEYANFHWHTLQDDERILVRGDSKGAIRDRRASLSEGWEADPYQVIGYTLWCADHSVDLDFARETVEAALAQGIAPDQQGEAFLWSNLADLHFAAGEFDLAVEAQERCVALIPQYGVFRIALAYFERCAEGDR